MVRHVDGGWDAMGVLCGKSGETLRHAFSGKDARYVPSMLDAEAISEACLRQNSQHCRAFVDAVKAHAETHAKGEIPAADVGVLRSDFAHCVSRSSESLMTATEALNDNHVSDNEYRECSQLLLGLIEAAQKAQRDLDAAWKVGKVRVVGLPVRGM
jgi:hypothetical protein